MLLYGFIKTRGRRMKKMDRWLNVLWEIGQYTKVMTKSEIRALQEIRVFIFKEKERSSKKKNKGE